MDKTYDANGPHMDSEYRRMRNSYVRFTREIAEIEAEPGPPLYANDWPHGEFRFEELPPPAGECVCGHPLHEEPCSVPVRMDEELRFVEEVCGCRKLVKVEEPSCDRCGRVGRTTEECNCCPDCGAFPFFVETDAPFDCPFCG